EQFPVTAKQTFQHLAGLVPANYVLFVETKVVDGRHKAGHEGEDRPNHAGKCPHGRAVRRLGRTKRNPSPPAPWTGGAALNPSTDPANPVHSHRIELHPNPPAPPPSMARRISRQA